MAGATSKELGTGVLPRGGGAPGAELRLGFSGCWPAGPRSPPPCGAYSEPYSSEAGCGRGADKHLHQGTLISDPDVGALC